MTTKKKKKKKKNHGKKMGITRPRPDGGVIIELVCIPLETKPVINTLRFEGNKIHLLPKATILIKLLTV